MTTPTREQVVQWGYHASKYESRDEKLVELARADLEATIAEQAKEIAGIKEALTQDYIFPGLPVSHSISELVAGYKDRNQSSATFMSELNAAEKVIAEQAKQLEEMAEAIRAKDAAFAEFAEWLDDGGKTSDADFPVIVKRVTLALAIQPSPEILAARDQRVAEAIAMWFDRHLLTAWIATHIRSGKWKKK